MKIKLMYGDCLERMKELPDNSIDCVLTDPPYGTTACKWDTVIDFELMWEQLKRITKYNGAIRLFGSKPFSSALRMSNIKMFKYDWIWHKNTTSGFVLAKKRPLSNHEIVSVFYNKQPQYFPIKEPRDLNTNSVKRLNYKYASDKGVNRVNGGIKKIAYNPKDKKMRYPTTVKKFSAPPNSYKRLHPTQKPVELLEYLIKTYTLENETVLDFTMGSGSTGVACKNLNRKFIGIENNKEYFKIARDRIKHA